MQVRELGEDALISRLREIFQIPPLRTKDLIVPNGDDGAVIAANDKALVASMDMATEGVHFRLDWSTPFEIGGKIAVANLSDVSAMGGVPKYLLVALALTGEEELEWVLNLARGIQFVASQEDVAIIGGDVVRSKTISVSITVLGSCQKPVLRSGAKVGDQLVVSSLPGFSRAGFLILEKYGRDSSEANRFEECVRAHLLPNFRGAEALNLAQAGATAMCDLSDGLIVDLERLSEASKVGFDLEITPKYLEPLQEVAEFLELSPVDLFLNSGEEHNFLGTLSVDVARQVECLVIGNVSARRGVRIFGKSINSDMHSWQHWKPDSAI